MIDEPAAWGVMRVGGGWVAILANEVQAETSRKAFDKMENWVHEVAPLYRHTQPALTDAERVAIADAADRYAEITPESAETAATLRALLARLSPPAT